jgi:hypothetical protein
LYEAENEVVDGIRKVGDLLNNGTLKICARCSNLIKEFQSYVWDSKSIMTGVDKPKKENDHALDSLRYAIYTHMFAKDVKGMSAQEYDRMRSEAYGGEPELPEFFRDPRDYGNTYIPLI